MPGLLSSSNRWGTVRGLCMHSILIVEDNPFQIELLFGALGDIYELYVAVDGNEALSILSQHPIDLILLDVVLPDIDGFSLIDRIRDNPRHERIPVIFITSLNSVEEQQKGFEAGAVDYIAKPYNTVLVKSRIALHLALSSKHQKMEDLVAQRTLQLVRSRNLTIQAMAYLAEARDPYTAVHLERVQRLTLCLAQQVARMWPDMLDFEQVDAIHIASILHDLGKIQVPDAILNKPGRLTEEEFAVIKMHPHYGGEALRLVLAESEDDLFLQTAYDIIIAHHEKWDGSGYPARLAGEAIPLSARIVSVVDVYDALTSRRPYKEPYSHDKAMAIITQEMVASFDPKVLEALREVEDSFNLIARSIEEP